MNHVSLAGSTEVKTREKRTHVSNANVPSTVVRDIHNELRRALILEVLQARQEVVLQVHG